MAPVWAWWLLANVSFSDIDCERDTLDARPGQSVLIAIVVRQGADTGQRVSHLRAVCPWLGLGLRLSLERRMREAAHFRAWLSRFSNLIGMLPLDRGDVK